MVRAMPPPVARRDRGTGGPATSTGGAGAGTGAGTEAAGGWRKPVVEYVRPAGPPPGGPSARWAPMTPQPGPASRGSGRPATPEPRPAV